MRKVCVCYSCVYGYTFKYITVLAKNPFPDFHHFMLVKLTDNLWYMCVVGNILPANQCSCWLVCFYSEIEYILLCKNSVQNIKTFNIWEIDESDVYWCQIGEMKLKDCIVLILNNSMILNLWLRLLFLDQYDSTVTLSGSKGRGNFHFLPKTVTMKTSDYIKVWAEHLLNFVPFISGVILSMMGLLPTSRSHKKIYQRP